MFLHESWFNSNGTLATTWIGSTFFTITNIMTQFSGEVHPISVIGWIITTAFATMAAISRWRLNQAKAAHLFSEARKNNAEAERIENGEDSHCLQKDECLYRDFYDKFSPEDFDDN